MNVLCNLLLALPAGALAVIPAAVFQLGTVAVFGYTTVIFTVLNGWMFRYVDRNAAKLLMHYE